jgi:hypothetical protein
MEGVIKAHIESINGRKFPMIIRLPKEHPNQSDEDSTWLDEPFGLDDDGHAEDEYDDEEEEQQSGNLKDDIISHDNVSNVFVITLS